MTPVREFRMLRFGTVEPDGALLGGAFEWTRDKAEAAASWFKRRGNRLMIDYDHQSFPQFNKRADGQAPAAGWIGGVEVRGDGLWATNVEWTDAAASALRSGEYRYFSPVIFWDKGKYGKVLRGLGPVALTNDPAMRDVPALAAGRGDDDQEMTVLSAGSMESEVQMLLGLSPSATNEDYLAAVTEANRQLVAVALGLPESASLEEVRQMMRTLFLSPGGESGNAGGNRGGNGDGGNPGNLGGAHVMRLAKELGLDGVTDEATLLSRIRTGQQQQQEATTELGNLMKRVGELEAKVRGSEFDTVCATVAARKITPAMKPGMKILFDNNRAEFDKVVAALPDVVGEESVFARDKSMAGGATEAGKGGERKFVPDFGAAQKKKREGK